MRRLEISDEERKREEYLRAARALDKLCTMEALAPRIKVVFAWIMALGVTLGLGLFTFTALVITVGWSPPAAALTAIFLHLVFIVICHVYLHGIRVGEHTHRQWWNHFLLVPLIILGLVIFAIAYLRIAIFTVDMGLGLLTPILTILLSLLEVSLAVTAAIWTVNASTSAEAASTVDKHSRQFRRSTEQARDPEANWRVERMKGEKELNNVIDNRDMAYARKIELAKIWETWIDKLDRFHPYDPMIDSSPIPTHLAGDPQNHGESVHPS